MKILPINNGYYNVKSIEEQMFKSKITRVNDFKRITKQYDILGYGDEYFGIGVGNPNFSLDKTENEITKLLILNMLCRFTENKEIFKIAISSPPLFYKEQKELLPMYLRGKYDVIFNDVKKQITIDDINVYPETFIAYCNYIDEYQDKLLLIIDIGGYTTNVCRIEQGAIIPSNFFTIQKGMYNINGRIVQHLNSNYYTTLLAEDMEFYYKNGLYISKSKDNLLESEKDNIEMIFDEHIANIINNCVSLNWDVNTHSVLCIGGGSIVLADTIKEYIPHAKISNNPVFDNLNALNLLAGVDFNE